MRALLLLGLLAVTSIASASDEEELTTMLNEFLAGASIGDVAVHESFWDDNLVYTSSNGTRTDKPTIVGGMRQAAAEAGDDGDSGPTTIYSAEEIAIDVYGNTAIVAFKLVGTPPEGSGESVAYYFNTGTFLKRDGTFKVVAWQATRIPDAED